MLVITPTPHPNHYIDDHVTGSGASFWAAGSRWYMKLAWQQAWQPPLTVFMWCITCNVLCEYKGLYGSYFLYCIDYSLLRLFDLIHVTCDLWCCHWSSLSITGVMWCIMYYVNLKGLYGNYFIILYRLFFIKSLWPDTCSLWCCHRPSLSIKAASYCPEIDSRWTPKYE